MCTCNSSSCNGTCGTSLIVNRGQAGPAGVGIQSITSSVNSAGETIMKITLTSGVVRNFTLPVGQQGVSVDHASITTSTLSGTRPPRAGLPGAIDTYTLWADADETIAIGTFQVYNGSNGLSEATFSNLGEGSPVFVSGSEYDFRSISSSNLTVTNDSEEVSIDDPRYPIEVVLSSTVENGVYNLAIEAAAYYQPIEITNKTSNIVTIAIPIGYSYEETPYLSSSQGLYLLPKATLRVWKSLKDTVNKVSVLSYKAKTYSAEVTDFQNSFNYDTDRIYARATESRQVSISGRLRYAGSSINDNGIVFNIPLPFRPARTVYFIGTMEVNSSSPSTLTSLHQQTSFPVTFSVSPAGVVTMLSVAAPIGSAAPVSFTAGSDVRFVKTYASTIRFTGAWDGAAAISSGPANPTG
jgi:hypothetical protein